jgi:hypothetical protein
VGELPVSVPERPSDEASRPPRTARVRDEPVLPLTTSDEADRGWGDDPETRERDAHWYESQRPPHYE